MAHILCIETTSKNCSVTLGIDGKIISTKELPDERYSHSERLHPYIEEVFDQSGYTLKALDAVAVSRGPGSYTGMRVGTSAAKGLCFALDIPLISIPTLEILIRQADKKDYDFIIPMLDAKRMEVYTLVYDVNKNQQTSVQTKVLDEQSYEEYLNQGKVLFIGTGSKKFEAICKHPQAVFIETFPSSREMVIPAQQKFEQKDFEDLAYFEPLYFKAFTGQ